MKYKLTMYLTSNHYGNTTPTTVDIDEGDSIDRLVKHFTKVGKEGHTLQHLTLQQNLDEEDDDV
jgi:hypothetical protein